MRDTPPSRERHLEKAIRKFFTKLKSRHAGSALVILGLPILLVIYLFIQGSAILNRSEFQLIARVVSNAEMTKPVIAPPTEENGEEEVDLKDGIVIKPDPPGSLLVYSRLLVDGHPAPGVHVWAVAYDAQGNSFSPIAAMTDSNGCTVLGPIPSCIGINQQSQILAITVRASNPFPGSEPLVDEVVLNCGNERSSGTVSVSAGECMLFGLVFMTSILIALASTGNKTLLAVKYAVIVLITMVLATAALLIYFEGARIVRLIEQREGHENISFGFIHIVKGSYLPADNPPDWIVALTPSQNDRVGFGAPMWVILVSVVGAVLMAMGKIIENMKIPGSTAVKGDMKRERDYHGMSVNLVLYQLFILFSPLGAIFLYQMMLLTGTADENITVAIAALAAGAGFSIIINKAITAQSNIFGKHKEGTGKTGDKE